MSDKKDFITPLAIVLAGAVIAGAVYFSNNKGAVQNQAAEKQGVTEVKVRPIQDNDLVKGNRNAEVIVIEYSDTECPFCKKYHEVMNKIMEEYSDKVAWVYRHFPLDQLHPKARKEAIAVECASKIAGPDTGFKYLDRLMELTPSNNGLDLNLLPQIAEEVGVDVNAFNTCLENEETKDKVQQDLEEAIASGARGTPHNVIIYGGKQIAIPGMLPYEQMKQVLDDLLSGKIQ